MDQPFINAYTLLCQTTMAVLKSYKRPVPVPNCQLNLQLHTNYITMKVVLALAVFACVAACAFADGYGHDHHGYDSYNRDGFRRVHNGISAPYSNEDRQAYVNHRAEHVGASSGTARYYGVPGTNRNFGYGGYGGHGYGGYGGYGHGGYGGYGHNGYW